VQTHEIWEPQPPGTLKTCTGIALHFLPFTLFFNSLEEFSLGNASTNGRNVGNNVGLAE
jgi:hypothetical protein